jgi:putative copper export protein
VLFGLAGGVLLIVSTLLTAVAQAAAAGSAGDGSDAGRALVDLLTRGRFASIWWPRLALSATCVMLVALNGLDSVGGDCALAMQPAVLLTSSLTSHGAALPALTLVGIVVDWLHVTGAVAWVGGLATLGVALTGPLQRATSADPGLPGHLVHRFTRMALVAAMLVAASGVAQAALEVGSLGLLLTTGYGHGVLAKAILLLAMLGLASRNQRAVGTRLVRGVRAELLLGAATLAVAAVLVGIPPARELAGPSPGVASGVVATADRAP